PSRLALPVMKCAGQLPTIAATAGSSVQETSRLVPWPATRSSAATMSPGVVVSAGRFIAVRLPHFRSVTVAAQMSPSTVHRGEDNAMGVSAGAGHSACIPASGSRMMLDRKLDAAALGFPGRTDTVINRTDLPRTNPFRV